MAKGYLYEIFNGGYKNVMARNHTSGEQLTESWKKFKDSDDWFSGYLSDETKKGDISVTFLPKSENKNGLVVFVFGSGDSKPDGTRDPRSSHIYAGSKERVEEIVKYAGLDFDEFLIREKR